VILPTPPYPGAKPLAQLLGAEQQHLYDAFPDARRAYVVGDAGLVPSVEWQIQGMFQARFDPARTILVSAAWRAGQPDRRRPSALRRNGVNRGDSPAAGGRLSDAARHMHRTGVDVDGTPAPLCAPTDCSAPSISGRHARSRFIVRRRSISAPR
jgi:hypothetical protein